MDLRSELNAELRKARGWLIGVGILMFVMDMVFIHVVYGKELPSTFKTNLTFVSLGLLAGFVALWWFTPKKPKACLIGGLVLFWGLHLFNAIQDPSTLAQGLLIKILFTYFLVQGLKSASRAEVMMQDLGEVFD